ncbi:MAG TPA: hypothetical protein VJB97_01740 [Candidatus Paceibacterota bacterium]
MKFGSRRTLTDLVGKHAQNTGSGPARRLLRDPKNLPEKFRVVVPDDLREALEKEEKKDT